MCGESIGAITFAINDLERSMSLRFGGAVKEPS